MKAKQLKTMSKDDLTKKLHELRQEMIKYRTQIAAGTSIKSPALVRSTKRTMARLSHQLNNTKEE